MSRHRIIIWFLLAGFVLGMVSCSQGQLQEAEAVVAAADSLRAVGQTYTDSLHLAGAYKTLGNRRWSNADEYAHACYYYGRLLREKDNPVEAMQVFINATHFRTHDYHILGRIYSNMGSLCHLAGEYDLSYDMYNHSANMFLSSGDTLLYYYLLNDMAFEMAEKGDKGNAILLLSKIITSCSNNAVLTKTFETRAAACFYSQQYDSAIYYAKQLYQLGNIEPTGLILCAQSYSYLGIKDSAVFYATRVLQISQDLFHLNNALYILTNDDETKDKEAIKQVAADRSDAQKLLEIRQGKLAQAVQLLEQDLNREPDIRWLYVLIGIITLAGGVIGLSYTYRHSQQMKNNARDQRKVLEQKCDALTHLSDKQLKDTIYWHDYAALCHFININLNNIVNKLLQLIPTLTEQNIRLCIVILLGCSYSRCAEMLLLSKSSISKLKQIMAEKLGTDIKNLRATLLDIACKNG